MKGKKEEWREGERRKEEEKEYAIKLAHFTKNVRDIETGPQTLVGPQTLTSLIP